MNGDYFKIVDTTIKEGTIRFKAVTKYYPFFKIMNKKYENKEFKEISPCEICMGLISFLFYEGKLKAKHITFIDIKEYLNVFLDKVYNIQLKEEVLYEFTINTIDIIQNTEGKGFVINFPKFMPSAQNIKYVISKSNNLGIKEYELTTSAIDFFLETKEFGEESKITISLLILKKLIEHNEYESALISLTNVNAEVIKQISKVYEIELGLMYSGELGYKTFLNYRELADKHQADEEELFVQTMEEIRVLREDYASKISKEELKEYEKNAFNCLDEMDKELIKTVELHHQLLGKVVILSKRANEILVKKKMNILKPTFDFSRYLDKLSNSQSAKSLEAIIKVILPLNLKKNFSLFKINELSEFESILRDSEENSSEEDEDRVIDTDRFNNDIKLRMIHNYKLIIKYFYKLLEHKEYFILSNTIKEANEYIKINIFANPDFSGIIFDFLRLNQDNVLENEKNQDGGEREEILEIVLSELATEYMLYIEVVEDSYIEVINGLKLNDIIIRKVKGEKYGF